MNKYHSLVFGLTAAALIGCVAADSHAAETWSEDRLGLAADPDDLANTCYFAIFTGEKCTGGGVYKITPDWYSNHFGGPFASLSGCGSVITNWLSKSGSHTQYKAKVDASEDIVVARATFEAPLDCSGPIVTTPGPEVSVATLDVAKTCELETVKKLNLVGVGQVFCAELENASTYRFHYLIPPDTNTWAAIGFNSGYSMPGTEVMWLGLESGEPKLRYKRATGYSKPADIGEVEPENLVVENTEKGLQATWTRPFQQSGLRALTADTSGLTILSVYKAGSLSAGFTQHDNILQLKTNLAEAGLSAVPEQLHIATGGNLAHGALMILAWLCLSPVATMWMKYGKHLPVNLWFKGHVYSQALAILITIIAVVLIVASGVEFPELTGKSKTHAQYGLAVLGLCVFQGLLGAVRERISGADHDSDKATDFPHGPNRFAFNALHRTNGWVLFVLAALTVYKGINVFNDSITDDKPKEWLQDPAPTIFVVWAVVAAAFVFIMEIAHVGLYTGLGPFSCSGKGTINATFKAKADWEMKLRSVLLSLFTAFSIATTVALWVIIGDTDKNDGFKKPE